MGRTPMAGIFERQIARFSEHYDLRLDQRTLLYWRGYVDGPIPKTSSMKIYDLEDAKKALHFFAHQYFENLGIPEPHKKLEDLQWEKIF
jgi:hypothetical protein